MYVSIKWFSLFDSINLIENSIKFSFNKARNKTYLSFKALPETRSHLGAFRAAITPLLISAEKCAFLSLRWDGLPRGCLLFKGEGLTKCASDSFQILPNNVFHPGHDRGSKRSCARRVLRVNDLIHMV